MMDKKELKDSRTKNFFVNAAKEIIMSEKIVALNVRDVSERAGYSPATLYKYFKDLNELTLYCVSSFVDDLINHIKTYIDTDKSDKSLIIKFFTAYTRYFVQYVGIYQLLFLETSSMIRNNADVNTKLSNLYSEFIQESDYPNIKSLYLQINGLMLFYLNRNTTKSYSEFSQELQEILNEA